MSRNLIDAFIERNELNKVTASDLNQLVALVIEEALSGEESPGEGPLSVISGRLMDEFGIRPVDLKESGGTNDKTVVDDPIDLYDSEHDIGDSIIASNTVERYKDIGPLGVGGMGEVRQVLDRDLNRTVAMKVIRQDRMNQARTRGRFLIEAQATGQLQHPGIVPVHEIGRLGDGRIYFTMREVKGRSLREVITEVHEASTDGVWEAGASGWSFRRLIAAFQRVCEAVAYAHDHGVIHRDLKPSNVMVGDRGETLVVDWGMAKILNRVDRDFDEDDVQVDHMRMVMTTRPDDDNPELTREGSISGTPAYMSPEQAFGFTKNLTTQSDVYSLGTILHQVLTGRAPFVGASAVEVIEQVRSGPPPLPGSGHRMGPPVPEELVAACAKAMERAQEDRFPDAGALAEEVGAWLEESRKREQALAVLKQAQAKKPEAAKLRASATRLKRESEMLLAEVKPYASESEKAEGWAKDDQARDLEIRANLQELEGEMLAHGALTIEPNLPAAHAELASLYRTKHAHCEALRDEEGTARMEIQLRTHAEALPLNHPDRASHFGYLKGNGLLDLVTDHPGAAVELYRYEEKNRRLVPTFVKALGKAPLHGVSLPMGSYVLVIGAPGTKDVYYPVCIGREEHWHGRHQMSEEPAPVHLPKVGELADDDIYVPCGWTIVGGDSSAFDGLERRRTWLNAFSIKRYPVTNIEYLQFLNDLNDSGQGDEAEKWAPREMGGSLDTAGAMIYGRRANGSFFLQPDADGDIWQPDWPVVCVNWWGARAYAQWMNEKTGHHWRLPKEFEWEKAARGVDGRFYPWGDFLDPSWSHTRSSHRGRILPAAVGSYPVDTSVYGVQDLGGNVKEWCMDTYDKEGPTEEAGKSLKAQGRTTLRFRAAQVDLHPASTCKGGSFYADSDRVRSASRFRAVTNNREPIHGFRLARSVK